MSTPGVLPPSALTQPHVQADLPAGDCGSFCRVPCVSPCPILLPVQKVKILIKAAQTGGVPIQVLLRAKYGTPGSTLAARLDRPAYVALNPPGRRTNMSKQGFSIYAKSLVPYRQCSRTEFR